MDVSHTTLSGKRLIQKHRFCSHIEKNIYKLVVLANS